MTITITYVSGKTETYTSVTEFSNNGSVVAFKGKLGGQDPVRAWQINWAGVLKIEMSQ